jgi:subtilisin family serine protease
VESDWVTALAQIAELVRRFRAGEAGGQVIDILSLSMGYYHENPQDQLFDPILLDLLEELSRLGVVVVCSAGNDATDRPSYPAAFAPWRVYRKGTLRARHDHVPVVSVGAQNPNATDALFTNAGEWVRAYEPGAALLSTMPAFEGGLEPIARTHVDDRVRESIDPDDFRSGVDDDGNDLGGFAVWSGTSFAAPVMAGKLAAAMANQLMNRENPGDSPSAAVTRAWRAVESHTDLVRPE